MHMSINHIYVYYRSCSNIRAIATPYCVGPYRAGLGRAWTRTRHGITEALVHHGQRIVDAMHLLNYASSVLMIFGPGSDLNAAIFGDPYAAQYIAFLLPTLLCLGCTLLLYTLNDTEISSGVVSDDLHDDDYDLGLNLRVVRIYTLCALVRQARYVIQGALQAIGSDLPVRDVGFVTGTFFAITSTLCFAWHHIRLVKRNPADFRATTWVYIAHLTFLAFDLGSDIVHQTQSKHTRTWHIAILYIAPLYLVLALALAYRNFAGSVAISAGAKDAHIDNWRTPHAIVASAITFFILAGWPYPAVPFAIANAGVLAAYALLWSMLPIYQSPTLSIFATHPALVAAFILVIISIPAQFGLIRATPRQLLNLGPPSFNAQFIALTAALIISTIYAAFTYARDSCIVAAFATLTRLATFVFIWIVLHFVIPTLNLTAAMYRAGTDCPHPSALSHSVFATSLGNITYLHTSDDDVPFDHIAITGLRSPIQNLLSVNGISTHWQKPPHALFTQLSLGFRQLELRIWHKNAQNTFFVRNDIAVFFGLSTCGCLSTCLHFVRNWSETHRGHVPILIRLVADGHLMHWCDANDLARSRAHFRALEKTVVAALGKARLFTPAALSQVDNVDHVTRALALNQNHWPSLRYIRDRILVVFSGTEPGNRRDACGALYEATFARPHRMGALFREVPRLGLVPPLANRSHVALVRVATSYDMDAVRPLLSHLAIADPIGTNSAPPRDASPFLTTFQRALLST